MAKNRIIPFGYCMKNGEITTAPKEVYAVTTIFSEYLNGSSLLQISKLMESEKIRYTTDSDHWNKNMVKRIIENEKYLGTDKYPQIIDEDTFRIANENRVKKATSVYQYKNWLGYKKGDDGSPEIVPEEAETVKFIYKKFLDGYATKEIADMLNTNGITTARDVSDWQANAVCRILRNEKYTGDALLQKTYTVDCITHKHKKNNGERAMYLVTDCHPAIIDRDSPRVTQSENPRYTFRCWLIRIGLNGDEFKNCRKHLLSHLDGNIAWLHPED